MGGFLGYRKIRVFDYPQWAAPLREELRKNAQRLAADAGLQIEFIRKLKTFPKEEVSHAIPNRRPFRQVCPCSGR